MSRRNFKDEHCGTQPEGNEAGRTQAAKHASPSKADKEVVAEQEVKTGGRHYQDIRNEAGCRTYPRRQNDRGNNRILH
jgi:hypothetical protein